MSNAEQWELDEEASLRVEILRLRAELAAARDDAERWRRARRHGVLKLGTPVSTEFVYNDEADDYMDAARSAEQQGEGNG